MKAISNLVPAIFSVRGSENYLCSTSERWGGGGYLNKSLAYNSGVGSKKPHVDSK